MPASQQHIDSSTPLGATPMHGGTAFRVWAPDATAVHVMLQPYRASGWHPADANLLVKDGRNYWSGFFPGVGAGSHYRLHIVGPGGSGPKRDPRAKELERDYPDCDCIVRGANTYPWHDAGFRAPAFNDLILYQLHVGVFYAAEGTTDIRHRRVSKFLDVLDRLEYLVKLGVNAIQPLPVVEWQGTRSRGYNNTDYFSPEMDYTLTEAELAPYVARVNRLLRAKGFPDLDAAQLRTQGDQLKAMVDLFHVYGIAVIFDVVYNHGGGPFDEQSMRFLEWPVNRQWWDRDSYFIAGAGWAGGRIFDYTSDEVRAFLIDNARMLLDEYHADGFRYDEVSVIRSNTGGERFCRDLTATLRHHQPAALHIAEDWSWDRATAVTAAPQGLGFDAAVNDRFRIAMRTVLASAAGGASALVDLDGLREALGRSPGYPAAWKAVVHTENHDLVDADRENKAEIQPRIPALAHWDDRRSWLARSRSRVATTLLVTAPGIPMLFMGQEFLDDTPWHNNPDYAEFLIDWQGLESSAVMRDFLRFTQELCALRRRHPALRGEGVNPYFNHNVDRLLACHRWVEGIGRDVIIVASLGEETRWGHDVPFPVGGRWLEVFNSDAYDSLPAGGGYNPGAAGNPSGAEANGPAMYGCPTSARMVLPANSVIVLARDAGDG